MNIYVSGENGFIASNLIYLLSFHSIISAQTLTGYLENDKLVSIYTNKYKNSAEIDFVNTPYENLKKFIQKKNIDLIIHNGAMVGSDVCSMDPEGCIKTNVFGTYQLAKIAKELNIPIIYIGTTVIYDTQKCQDRFITEESPIFPRTLYATTKYEGELIIKAFCKESKYCIIRPLFCYGGKGDMNSLIAKTLYNGYIRKKDFTMFLDLFKFKDYIWVSDFCEAILQIIRSRSWEFNTDFNISRMEPKSTYEIIGICDRVSGYRFSDYISWSKDQDYLGNHLLSNEKFMKFHPEWKTHVNIEAGVRNINNFYCNSKTKNQDIDYNPFSYYDSENYKIDVIKENYNFRGNN